jgi:hypothetical protein
MRLIFVPQYPTKLRYQDWWSRAFPREFKKHFSDVRVLGDLTISQQRGDAKMFSPIDLAIKFELSQINQYLDLNILEDDILFVADLSFPGFFINALYHKKPKRCYAFCHATSINKYDYFEPVRDSKFLVETGHHRLFDKIFLGSYYHKRKLSAWNNTIVTRLPKIQTSYFEEVQQNKKIYDIISVSRPTQQKVDLQLEKRVEDKFGKIIRYEPGSWDDYFSFVSKAKIMLVSAQEETFGYQVLDAVMCGTIPICPNRLSYPELLDRTYLYNDFYDLKVLLSNFLEGIFDYKVPELLCQNEIDNFYENICRIMKGE